MTKRRVWSDDEKRMICGQTRVPGVSVSQVARRYDVKKAKISESVLRQAQKVNAAAKIEAQDRKRVPSRYWQERCAAPASLLRSLTAQCILRNSRDIAAEMIHSAAAAEYYRNSDGYLRHVLKP